ncbi:MAG TPA: CHASE3 domain-containing protein, partial [Flavobacteriales bacterium]|nr:CHASE3 domain-containing protein [Flavobacteriales bacterium]
MPLESYRRQDRERRVTSALYWCVLALLVILLYVTWLNLRTAQENAERIRKYNYTLIELDGLFGLMRDQESGSRGFLLTRDQQYLAPFVDADPRYDAHRYQLDSLYSDNQSPAKDSLVVLSIQLRYELRELNGRIDSTTVIGPELSERVQRTERIMDLSRGIFSRLMAETRAARDRLLAAERGSGFDAPSMVILYSALAIAATAILFWRLSRALDRAERMKLALDLKVVDLNKEVKERTTLQDMLQNVLDTSPSGIMAFRSIRDRKGKVIDFEWISSNESANSLLDRDDLVGKQLLREIPEVRENGMFDAYEQVVATGDPFIKEVHEQDGTGRRWFVYHAVKLEDGFVVTFSDLTELKRAQEVNIETDRLALTAQITRTIAHEVRNPLTNIHLSVEQVQDEMQDRKELVEPYFGIIERNLRRIGTLVKQMLESSSIRELKLAPCSVRDIADNVLEAVSDRLRLKGMKGHVEGA